MSKVPLLRTHSPGIYGAAGAQSELPANSRGNPASADTTLRSSPATIPEPKSPAVSTRSEPTTRHADSASTLRHRPSTIFSETKANVSAGYQAGGLEGLFMPSTGMPGEVGMETIKSQSSNDSLRSSAARRLLHEADDEHPIEDGDVLDSTEELTSVKSRSSEGPVDNSPYPQVRASVSATDDLSLSINTPRMWTLSIAFAILGSATNLFFSLRYPSVSITPVIALLLVHPLGLLWDRLLKRSTDPKETFVLGELATCDVDDDDRPASQQSADWSPHDGASFSSAFSRRTRLRLWLAQGRWNEKEHACVYISSNVSFGFAFATDVIVEQTKFYLQDVTITYQLLLIISTQVLGYAIAGLTRRYLVRPGGMIWPATLISTAMFSTLHKNENRPANGWRMSRWKFFVIVFTGAFIWYFVPGLLMPALSYFNPVTWFAPDNVPVANLFGVSSGLGMLPITFDWSQIAYTGSPLVVPFWAAMNVAGGLISVMWIAAPIMYFMNTLYSSYMPILSASVFDNKGRPYDVSRILTNDFLFDSEAYKNYSQVFLPITYVLSYAAQFASITALLVHTGLWHGKDIATQWRRSLAEARSEPSTSYKRLPNDGPSPGVSRRPTRASLEASTGDLEAMMNVEDVHNRLMRRYDDVPYTWYLIVGVAMLAIGIFTVEYYPVHLPWYGLLLAVAICCILFIPIGIVMAITAQQSSIYLVCQLVCGILFPGRPVANMVFVVYGYITSTQGLKFSADLKLGHYMKIPPRILFSVQIIATLVASCTQIGVLNWMLTHITGICTPYAVNGFSCPLAKVHFNGSILWGVLGPARFLGPSGMYRALLWAFPVGVVAPIVPWLLARRPRAARAWRKVNLPIILGSLSWIPPATGLNFSVWALVCFAFNYVVRNRHEAWWRKYNMTLSAALDAGVAFGVAVVFFALVYPGLVDGFSWWGTEVYKQGCDWRACPLKRVDEGEIFGPGQW